uniref:Protein-arginine kinase n=1 Tax=candidate division WOR-3 bacterium TaxID=2052148 RepID=A0A7C4XK25_UNCW3
MLNNIKWLIAPEMSSNCEDKEIVVSTRIRLARNLENIPFEIKMKPKDIEYLINVVRSAIEGRLKGRYLLIQKLTPLERESLLESHLVSPAFVKADRPGAVFINEKGNISVMVNEEDHLRIQGLSCGLNLTNTLIEVFEVEEFLGENLGYAFNENYGFITSCPTNLGTGMRVSVLLHLPGLVYTNEVDKILKSAVNLGMAVRGLYGEGSEIKGNLFQISNQRTLGYKEEELVQNINRFTRMVIDIEQKTRGLIYEKARYEFEDKVYRSLAILRSARLLSSDETLNLLSAVRLGVGMGIINDVTLDTLNEIMLVTRPGNIQFYFGEILEAQERDVKRAEYVRKRLTSS